MLKTIENLAKAYVGECQARNRYTFYAKIAVKEGFQKVGDYFNLTAENETEHAKWLFRLINQLLEKEGKDSSSLNVEAEVPTMFKDTISNVKASIEGENFEQTQMYPEFAKVAREEGLNDIANRLEAIAIAEKHHEQRFRSILKALEEKSVLKKSQKVYWVCRKCGYLHEGNEPPKECPSCSHPTEYFDMQCDLI